MFEKHAAPARPRPLDATPLLQTARRHHRLYWLLAPGMPRADGAEPHSDQNVITLDTRGQVGCYTDRIELSPINSGTVMPIATARTLATFAAGHRTPTGNPLRRRWPWRGTRGSRLGRPRKLILGARKGSKRPLGVRAATASLLIHAPSKRNAVALAQDRMPPNVRSAGHEPRDISTSLSESNR